MASSFRTGTIAVAAFLAHSAFAPLPEKLCLLVHTRTSKPNLAYVAETFRQTEIEFNRASANRTAGMAHIFQSRELVPPNGSIHVVGPSTNFMEWVAPLLARKDVNIVVSEPEYANLNDSIRDAWRTIMRHPGLKAMGEFKPETEEEFVAEVNRRIRFNADALKTEGNFSLVMWHNIPPMFWNPIAKNDVQRILSRGEAAWVSSEHLTTADFPAIWERQELRGDFSKFLPKEEDSPALSFNGQWDSGLRGFLLRP